MSKLLKAQTQQGHSKTFFEYIRDVGEAKSRQEEEKIVLKDLHNLKKSLASKTQDKKLLKEYVVRTCYAEMLGHSVEWSHINGVNLSSSTDILCKRTGYLATWLCVSPEHEFMYLVVANLQKDMKSSNFLDVCASLSAAGKLLRTELISAINSDVTALLSHQNPLVRKKAVQCMHAFYLKSAGAIGDTKLFRQALCDRDASVMGAALALLADVIAVDAAANRDLIPSFISILKQITEHRLTRDYDYRRAPAPWLQMRILRLLAALCGDDATQAAKFVEFLPEVIKRAESGTANIGHALTFETIRTITSIHAIPSLVELAAEATSKFLMEKNANLRYMGIEALTRIVRIDAKYAREHQQVVMACLEDSDETIRRRTLHLLLAICNSDNVAAVVGRLIKFLSEASDTYLRQELTRNICAVAERFATSAVWYIDSINAILGCAAEHVPQETIQGVLKLIAEGEGNDEAEDAELRTYCVETYFALTETTGKLLPPQLYQVAAWVMGEYGFLTKKMSRAMLLDRLCDILERVDDAPTKGWVVTAMMKLVAHNGSLPDNVEDLVCLLKNSRSVGLQRRCYEFMELVKMPVVMKKILPLDGCCEEVEIDENLSFLDTLVQDALSKGAPPYEKRKRGLGAKEQQELRTDAYKTQRPDVVDESELNAEKFNTTEADKLIIKAKTKRWGLQNLESEAAVEMPVDSTSLADPAMVPDAATGIHVDPNAGGAPEMKERHRPTKNEKFLNDIFGGDGGKKLKGKESRAAETKRRAAEASSTQHSISKGGASTPSVVAQVGTASGATERALRVPQPGFVPASVGPSSSPPLVSSPPPAASAATLQLGIQKHLGSDLTVLRVGLMSPSVTVRFIRVQITPPPMCTAARVSCPVGETSTLDGMGAVVHIPQMTPGQPVVIELALEATDFPLGGATVVEVQFEDPTGATGTAKVMQAMALIDILRPHGSLTTEQFGSYWPHTSGEYKVQLKFKSEVSPDSLQQHLLERVGLKIIQVIGKECIAAAKVVPVGHMVLCHLCVVDAVTVNVTVRTSSLPFAEAVAKMLAMGL